MIKGFYNIKIPEVILEFLCVLLNVDHKGFYNIKIPEVILEFLCVLLNVDHKGFYNIKIPEVILEFLYVLLNVDHKGFYNIKIPEVILEFLCVLLNVDHKGFYNDVESNPNISITKRRKMIALYQIMFYDVNNGKKKTPLHVLNAEMIHDACRSKTLVTNFNHYGLGISYPELLRYHTDMASYVLSQKCDNLVPLPSHFHSNIHTTAAFDNFDHNETLPQV